jgi:predicted GNAT family N-acyltransferase
MAIEGGFRVEVCDWRNERDREALVAVREEVFVREQSVPREMELDDDDPRSVHVLARGDDGVPMGTGRLSPEGKVARMAVLPTWRGRGVGSAILSTLLDEARTRGVRQIVLHAQRGAIRFYRTHGFESEGEPFAEAGIPHVVMRRVLDPLEPPGRPPLPARPEPTGLHASTREELISVTHALLTGAKHSMSVLVREIHPQLLDDTACLVQLRRLAISGRGASIRVLTQDITRALEDGNRMFELAQRLPSVFEIRRPVEDADREYPSAFMCVDTGGYLFRPIDRRMAAEGSTYAPGRHALLMAYFEQVWARSESWPELRLLGL